MPVLDLIKINRKHSLDRSTAEVWTTACDELGLDLQRNASTAEGVVGGHDVTVSLVAGDNGMQTTYTVALDTPHTPEFTLTHSPEAVEGSLVDLTFEGLVSIATDQQLSMLDFLTTERRTAIKDALCRWQIATLTKQNAIVATEGVETDPREIVSAIEQLVALADVITPCWTEVALDEGSVLEDLFKCSRTEEQIADRFNELYRAGEVSWTGEILQVGSLEKLGRRVVMFVGTSACSTNMGSMWGGRVVAMTYVDPEVAVMKGDVVTFAGAMKNLDAKKRLFRIEDSSSWKPRKRAAHEATLPPLTA